MEPLGFNSSGNALGVWIMLSGRLMNGWRFAGRTDYEEFAIVGRVCGTLGPEELDPLQPLPKCLSEALVPGIGRGAELGLQSLRAKERYPGGRYFHSPAFPDDPDVEVKQAGRVGPGRLQLAAPLESGAD